MYNYCIVFNKSLAKFPIKSTCKLRKTEIKTACF